VALVGAGNVMLDIARWMIREKKVDEVIAVVRRGPAEVKFDKKEMESVVANLDQTALDEEIARVAHVMTAIGQDVQAARDYILSALPKAKEPVSETRFLFDFLASPTRILGDESGHVAALEVEETTLALKDGDTKARGTGVKRQIAVDTVVFCIGDRVDETFGLPVKWNEFVKNPAPRFPIDGVSYEAFDPETGQPVEGVFVAGWSREASSGLVGVARKDGENGARVVLQHLQGQPPAADPQSVVERLKAALRDLPKPVVVKEDIQRLEDAERAQAEQLMLEEFKFSTNEEMLAAMDLTLAQR
jgi:ferredoxin--NADP+ reductase